MIEFIFHNEQGELLAINLNDKVPTMMMRYADKSKVDENLGVVSLNYSYYTKNESGLYQNCIIATCYRKERDGCVVAESYLCDLETWTFVNN